jgi:UDP-glucose 4-epimerase
MVGTAVCTRLLLAGFDVTAICRNRRPKIPESSRFQSVFVRNFDDPDVAPAFLAGARAVIHLAAAVHQFGKAAVDAESFRRCNVQGTRALATMAEAAGVGRFVFMSSVKALAESSSHGPLTESHQARPADFYGISKRDAEIELERLSEISAMGIVIVRSPLVYGEGAIGNFRELVRWVRRGIPLPLAAVTNRRSLIYVDNLADFCARALETVPHRFAIYHVADQEPLSTPQLIRLVAKGIGVHARLFPVPQVILAGALRRIGRHELVDRLLGSLELDSGKAMRELGWRPPHSIDVALPRAVAGMNV